METQIIDKSLQKIHKRFISEDAMRVWMRKSFNVGNKTASTNGWVLVVTPKIDDYEDYSHMVKGVYPVEYNTNKVINVDELKEKMKIIPQIDSFDIEEEEIECEACNGDGVVDFEFDYGGRTYEHESDCPICDGEGVIYKEKKVFNGKKEYDPEYVIKIGVCRFLIRRIEDLLFVSDTLQAKEITLVSQIDPCSGNLFKIKDVEILVMPASIMVDTYPEISI